MLYARRATQNQKEASAMNSIKPIKLKPNMIFAEPTLTPDEFTKNLEQHLSFSWLLCRKNNKTALYQLNLVDFLEFHVRIIIMSDLQLKVVLGKSLEVEDSRLEYWWQLKEILQKYDQNMHTGVLEELGLPDIKQEYKMNEGLC